MQATQLPEGLRIAQDNEKGWTYKDGAGCTLWVTDEPAPSSSPTRPEGQEEKSTPAYEKEIVFDRESRDYALYLNKELVGFARTYTEGEATLDSLVYELLNQVPSKPSEIPVSADQIALVDDEDYPRVAAHAWHMNGRGYAITTLYNPKRTVSLHRFIMQATDGDEVDHQNGNKLDCRKANLRIATRAQNIHNRGKRRDGRSSQYKGVRKHNECDRWEANIGVNGRRQYLGIYTTEEEAARAYDAAAHRVYGEFAYLNFPNEHFTEAA